MYRNEESAAAENAAFIKTAFGGLDDPGDDNASRVKAGAEAVSKADASAEASKVNNSTELLGNASENALIVAVFDPPDAGEDELGRAMLESAQKLGRQGFHVFPIAAGAKIPPITGWQGLATTAPDKIRRLWTQEYWNAAWLDKQLPRGRAMAECAERIRKVEAAPPGKPKAFNIGIFTGAPLPDGRRFFALDFDKKGGKTKKGDVYEPATAQERRDQLIAEVGKEKPTPLARTATGGAHALYACPIGVEVTSDVGLIPGVDVRARGAYIVGPGSVIEGGGEYVWAKNGEISEKLPIAEASEALLTFIKARAEGERKRALDAAGNLKVAEGVEVNSPATIARVTEWLEKEAPESVEGDGGHDTLLSVAHTCMDLGSSLEMTAELMAEHWDPRNGSAWGSELLDQVLSLATSRQTPIGSMTIEAVFPDLPPDDLAKAMAPPAPELAEKIAVAQVAVEQRAAAQAAEADAIAAEKPHTELSGAAWRRLVLPPKECLLGQVFHRTSRWMVYGGTGAGKTLFKMDMFGAMASGKSFLNWEGSGRPARVLYLDGELAADTFQERVVTTLDRYGCDDTFFAYNRDVLGEGEMPPLNTDKGEAWLWRKIEATEPDAICFDSLFCLAIGDMRDEESWSRLHTLSLKITAKRIAQAWVHHTGHNADHGYGSKVKEWGMTAVLALKANEKKTESARAPHVQMSFDKARERNEKNWTAFASQEIAYTAADGWAITGAPAAKGAGGRKSDRERFEDAMLGALARLDGGQAGKKIAVDALRDELKAAGELEPNDQGKLPGSERMRFQRARHALCDRGALTERNGLVWRAGK
jgi:hypothetical protein